MNTPTPESISRTLYTHRSVPIYAVPPLSANSTGYKSSQWLQSPPMFTALLELVETSSDDPANSQSRTTQAAPPSERLTASLNLLDPSSRELFAGAPYTHASVVTPCADSGRYFTLRVADDAGRKATLGIGFETREEAFEFIEALRSMGKVLGLSQGEKSKANGHSARVLHTGNGTSGFNIDTAGSAIGTSMMITKDDIKGDPALFAIEPPPPSPVAVQDGAHTLAGRREVNADTNDIDHDGDDDFGDFQ